MNGRVTGFLPTAPFLRECQWAFRAGIARRSYLRKETRALLNTSSFRDGFPGDRTSGRCSLHERPSRLARLDPLEKSTDPSTGNGLVPRLSAVIGASPLGGCPRPEVFTSTELPVPERSHNHFGVDLERRRTACRSALSYGILPRPLASRRRRRGRLRPSGDGPRPPHARRIRTDAAWACSPSASAMASTTSPMASRPAREMTCTLDVLVKWATFSPE